MTIGERIQQLRQGQGLSQEALAEQLHISRQAVSKWENCAKVQKLVLTEPDLSAAFFIEKIRFASEPTCRKMKLIQKKSVISWCSVGRFELRTHCLKGNCSAN